MARDPAAAARYWQEARDFIATLDLTESSHPAAVLMAGPYVAYLTQAGLKHIPIRAILAPHSNQRGAVQNSLPPQRLWANILPTLRVADRLAADLGERIHINSVYRTPAYNAACPGAAKWSQHLRNRALDLSFQSSPVTVARLAHQLRDRGVFSGGIGVYKNFVHLDTRGVNSDWG